MSEKKQLQEMQEFLASKKMIRTLADRAGVSVSTVNDTFKAPDFESLVCKQLLVYQTAIDMINEIKAMPALAQEALQK